MKKIVIIGGGIAGLSAGIFAQKNGFDSIILEKHHTLGGECTGWDRQGYHIDGCIHWLVGTKKGTPMHELWTTVGALDGVEVHHPESFLTAEHEGVTVHLYRDLDKLRASWLEISPEDKDAIDEFYRDVKSLHSFEMPTGKPMDLMTLIEKIKFLLSMKEAGKIMSKYGKTTLSDWAQKFKHPALRGTLATFLPEGKTAGYSAAFLFFALATFTKGQASVPVGGSRALAMRMVERYRSLGGTIETSCEVADLVIAGNKVQRVVAKNGKVYMGDYVVAACDAHVLYEKLLKGRYPDQKFQQRYTNPADYPLGSEIRIALGYEGTMEDIPRTLRFPIEPLEINNTPINRLQMTHYQAEPSFAPQGHTVITCSINQFYEDYDAWHALAQDSKAYRQEKVRISQAVQGAIEARFPHMQGKLKVLDVATPKTFERYCNAYRGAFMGFLPTIRGKEMAHNGRIKGIKNLHLSGQWLQPPGGLPIAVITGKDTIMRLCKEEKRPFISA